MAENTVSKQAEENKVENNIGLVHLCAKRFQGRGIEYDDLFQAGCVGLIKASDNFKAELGNKFSTYAVPVILGEIRGLFRDGGAVKVSRGVRELARKAQMESDKIKEETGKTPTVLQIADKLGVSPEKTAMALGASKAPVSLTSGDENIEMQIPVEAPEEQMTERITLYQILDTLEENDRKLIEYRYFANKTQQETAGLLGMTQVQVSRREKKLLLHMRSLL